MPCARKRMICMIFCLIGTKLQVTSFFSFRTILASYTKLQFPLSSASCPAVIGNFTSKVAEIRTISFHSGDLRVCGCVRFLLPWSRKVTCRVIMWVSTSSTHFSTLSNSHREPAMRCSSGARRDLSSHVVCGQYFFISYTHFSRLVNSACVQNCWFGQDRALRGWSVHDGV